MSVARSKSAELALWLERQITTGVWPINSQIPTEGEIATEHRVGRSTVREATRSLVNLGMLESLVGRGTFVRSKSPVNSLLASYLGQQPLEQVLELRRALEAEAAALAASRRTEEQLAALQHAVELAQVSPQPRRRTSQSPGEFHADVFAAAQAPLLSDLYRSVLVIIRGALDSGRLQPMAAEASVADHQQILSAIKSGDPAEARAAAAAHVDRDVTLR